VNDFLSSLYKDCSPAPWHKLISRLWWYRIDTTNIDDVIENSYQAGGVQQLVPIIYPHPDQDQDMWFRNVQCIHLHGSVLDFSEGLTCTSEEFAVQTTAVNPWYQALVNGMRTKSFMFIGTRINEVSWPH
jgi:hypothetical protein